MAENPEDVGGVASLPSKRGTRWQDRMVMPFPSLRRTRSTPPGADQIIDLSDGAEADVDDDVEGEAHAQAEGDVDPEADAAVAGPAAAEAEAAAAEAATAEAAAAEAAAAEARRARAERRTRRFASLVGFLSLRSEVGASLSPAAAVVVAGAWLTGWVLLMSLTLTAAIGLVSHGPVFRPDTFIDCWRLVHLMPIASAAGPVSLVPMLPAMAVLALVLKVSDWLWLRLSSKQEGLVVPATGVAALAAAYLVVAVLIATSPTAGGSEGPFTQGWLALFGIVGTGVGLVLARGYVKPQYPRTWLLFRAAGTVLTLLLAMSFLMVIVQLLVHWSQFWDMSVALLSSGAQPSSRFDAAALGAVQLGYLPNAVVWAAAYLIGAGFAVGDATIVSPFSVTLGTLPELPLVSLVPTKPMPWPWLPPLLVACASMLAGSVIRNAGLAKQMRTRLVVGLVVAFISAVGMGVLAAASNGGLGPGRLATVGPAAGLTFLWTLLVIGFGQVAWALFPTLVTDVGPFAEHGRQTMVGLRGKRLPRPRPRRKKGQTA